MARKSGWSVSTTELYNSTKKRQHYFDILVDGKYEKRRPN